MKVDLDGSSAAATISVMQVRRATADDLPRLLEMGGRFARETVYRERFTIDPARMKTLAEQLVAGDAGQASAVWVTTAAEAIVGMIGLFVFDHVLGGRPIAVEVFWWVDPEHRRSGAASGLLRAAEEWAKDAGATEIQMIAPTADVARIYEKRGYHALETTYARTL